MVQSAADSEQTSGTPDRGAGSKPWSLEGSRGCDARGSVTVTWRAGGYPRSTKAVVRPQ